jgi:hypothetical protein
MSVERTGRVGPSPRSGCAGCRPARPAATEPSSRPASEWSRRAVIAVAAPGDLFIGAGAFRLSFASLVDLAQRAGLDTDEAWVWPLIVDGLIVVATVAVVALDGHGPRATRYPWILLITAAAVSVAANAIHALVAPNVSVPAVVAGCVGAVPPLVLLGTTHLTVELIRWSSIPLARSAQRSSTRSGVPAASDRQPARPAPLAAGAGQAARLREQGWSNRQIARQLRVHPSTVGRWLRLPAPRPPAAIAAPARIPRSHPVGPNEAGTEITERKPDERR